MIRRYIAAGAALSLMALVPLKLFAGAGAELKLPDFRSLQHKATDSVDITLGSWMLRTAGALVGDDDEDSADTKRLLNGIKSIQIRNFQFATDFAYSKDDVDAVRKQLAAPGWSSLMQVHDRAKNEDVDMAVLMENDQPQGFALICSGPRDLTIVNIVGTLRAEDVPKLGKHLHLPKLSSLAVF